MKKVAILGYGTIGSGVAEILYRNKDIISKNAGEDIVLDKVLDLRDIEDVYVKGLMTKDFTDVLEDDEIAVVVESMGGLNPAYPFAKACLERGKHVITSNKALVAAHGSELLELASANNVNFLFEASVGGGIPIIRPMYRCLIGERFQGISGIINGTTNFILTKMNQEGVAFEEALKEAQDLGYAERDPAADVEGHDTCRKIAILSSIASGKEVNYEEIYTEGITRITEKDFLYAKQLGANIKLLACSNISDGVIEAYVAPVMVGKKHPLYSVNDVFNGIVVDSDMLGTSMYYGAGAGKLATASAVIADVIESVKFSKENVFAGWTKESASLTKMEDTSHKYFVRINGSLETKETLVKEYFPVYDTVEIPGVDEFAILTDVMKEAEFLQQKAKFEEKGTVIQVLRTKLD